MRENKRAALELSIGTIVVLVIAMTMLILGLVLIRGIFSSATESVESLDDKVKSEIIGLFTDQSDKVVVKLGADKTAKIKAGTQNFGIAIGAKTRDGSSASESLQYKLSLDEGARDNCLKTLGKTRTEQLFKQNFGKFSSFDKWEGDSAFTIIQADIPEGTPLCTQKVHVDVKEDEESIGRDFFIIQV